MKSNNPNDYPEDARPMLEFQAEIQKEISRFMIGISQKLMDNQSPKAPLVYMLAASSVSASYWSAYFLALCVRITENLVAMEAMPEAHADEIKDMVEMKTREAVDDAMLAVQEMELQHHQAGQA